MIDYSTFCRIRMLSREHGLRACQIARELRLHAQTVSRWLKMPSYCRRRPARRAAKLDAYRAQIIRWVEHADLSAVQVLQRLRERGYGGGYTAVKDLVRRVRPPSKPAYLTLSFAPGECAQVDWGCAGAIDVGQTRRRLSFFVMVLCHSRMLYVEFTLAETQEHFLACHQNAFEYFGGVPRSVMIDNLRSAVLSHPAGQPAIYHPRYLDFARHYGLGIRACNVGAPNEKGRVENAVRYIKTNFLRGQRIEGFAPLNPAARHWLDTVANVRLHAGTHRRPIDLFEQGERAALLALPPAHYDVGATRQVSASSQFRVTLDTNRYSVPSEYASRQLTMRVYPERLCLYHEHKLIAEHARRYERNQDYPNPDHQRELLRQRRKAHEQQLLMRMLRICPRAEEFYRGLEARRVNPLQHVRKIVALGDIYGQEALGRAIDDATELEAFSSEYITNILEQRTRLMPEPGALHLTRRQDLLEIELPEPDLSIYQPEYDPDTPEP